LPDETVDLDHPFFVYMRESVAAHQASLARQEAVEKSLDLLVLECRNNAEVVSRSVAVLDRLASAEEIRAGRYQQEVEQDKADRERRIHWFETAVSSKPVQFLLMGLAMGALQLLGIAYMLPSAGDAP
jgi:hypothetical protein